MPPHELCKYLSLSSEHAENTLSRAELYFSPPKKFDDLSDCKPFFRFDDGSTHDKAAWYQTTITALVRNDPRYDPERQAALAEEYLKRYPQADEAMQEAAEKILERDLRERRVGVLCLTETFTDPVMFLHYADKHRGVCLRFSVAGESLFSHAEPVEYQSSYPVVDFFDQSDNETQYKTIFLRKYDGWSYEHEWRVVDFINGPGVHEYPMELLSGVVFGISTRNEEKAKVRQWLSRRGHPVALYQARQQPDSYQLAVDRIE